eukprot:292793_1
MGNYWNSTMAWIDLNPSPCAKSSTKSPWIDLNPSPCANIMTIPTGIDKNNYIVIDTEDAMWDKIVHIYKYNIHKDKWIKMYDYTMENMDDEGQWILDVKKQILFLFYKLSCTEIELNSGSKRTYKYGENHFLSPATKSVIVNDSFYFVQWRHLIFKWNPEKKTFPRIIEIRGREAANAYCAIYDNNKHLLLFGRRWCDNKWVHEAIQFNIQTFNQKSWEEIEKEFWKNEQLRMNNIYTDQFITDNRNSINYESNFISCNS